MPNFGQGGRDFFPSKNREFFEWMGIDGVAGLFKLAT